MTRTDRRLLRTPDSPEKRQAVARRVSAPVKREVSRAIRRGKRALRKLAYY